MSNYVRGETTHPVTEVTATNEPLLLRTGGGILALPMRRGTATMFAVLCAAAMFCTIPTLAQQSESQRKVLNKVIPTYPELARHMNLHGAVRLEVVVAPNGSVKSMQALGGSPLLLQAAQGAVQKWKWAPAPLESHELIELKFGAD